MTARAGESAQSIKFQAQQDPPKRWAHCCAPLTPALNSVGVGTRVDTRNHWPDNLGEPDSLPDLVSKLEQERRKTGHPCPPIHTQLPNIHIDHTLVHTYTKEKRLGETMNMNGDTKWRRI